MDSIQGTVILKILKATLNRDTELIGKMAPYCTISINNLTSKTTVKKNYGKNPEWYEVFSFTAKLNDMFTFKIWDRDLIGSDDLIAEGTLKTKKDFMNMKYCLWVPLFWKNAEAGQIQIDIEFIPSNESLVPLMALLEDELKETQMLLSKFEGKPYEPAELNEEVFLSREATAKKIKELNDQISQLKIEYQTKSDEINDNIKSNTKQNTELKTMLAEIQKQLDTYQSDVQNGVLQINVLDGVFTRDVGGIFDKMDPFIIFTLGVNKTQTKIKKDSGSKAVFNENLEMQRTSEDELGVIVLDYQDNLKHRGIGQAFISIKECVYSNEVFKFRGVKLWYKEEEAGSINFDVKFVPT